MADPEARLKELGIELPGPQPAVGNYVSAKRDGDLVVVSGHGPLQVGQNGMIPGAESRDISVEDALGALIQGKVFLVEVFGNEVGRHARSAVGMAELPLNIPVEIELVAAVRSE